MTIQERKIAAEDVPNALSTDYLHWFIDAADGKPKVKDHLGNVTDFKGADGDVPGARQIIAGAGLSGGGDLTADRTLTNADRGSVAVTAHEAAANPHPVYLTQAEADAAYDAAGAAAEVFDDHVANEDPHTQYLTEVQAATDYQPKNSGLTAIAALTTQAYGRGLLELANQAALQSEVGATAYTDEQAQDAAGAMVSGNTEDGLSVTYDDTANKLNFTNTDKGSSAVATHEAAGNPHPQYLTQAEGDAAYDTLGAAAAAGAAADAAGDAADAAQASIEAHITDPSAAHAASAISIADTAGDFTATNVEDALAELQSDHEADATALSDHIADTTAAHAASAISIADAGSDFDATNVEDALAELQADHESDSAALAAHIADSSDAHDASAVSVEPSGLVNTDATDVQGAIQDLDSAILAPHPAICDGRLTLESGVPVSVSDQTAKTDIYFTPYTGESIALYNGSKWELKTFSELSLALGTLTADKNYDVFSYINAGAVALELSAPWTNDSTRADALAKQNGILVKSGAVTRRYLGTFRTTSTTTTEDSAVKRLVWNAHKPNRVRRPMLRRETTDNWTYSTATLRQANGSAANQFAIVIGYQEDTFECMVLGSASNSTSSARSVNVGIGVNSTTAASAESIANFDNCTTVVVAVCRAHLNHIPSLGYSFYAWLERGSGSDTQTWLGDGGVTDNRVQNGMIGVFMA